MSFIGNAIGKFVGGITGANQAADAAQGASQTQSQAALLGIDEQRRQFDALQAMLGPYAKAGVGALTGQQDLLGLNGAGAEQSAINGITSGPQYQSILQQGNDNILGNASATGGLRGGNVQSALGQFAPGVLAQLIQQRFANLGGITATGQSSAAGVGSAGLQTGNNVAQLLQQQGAAQAGGQIAQGNTVSNGFGALAGIGGLFAGVGGVPGIKKLF